MTVTKHFTKNSKKEKKATATQKDSHKEGMLELRKKMTSGRQSSELSEHGRVVEEKCLNHRNKEIREKIIVTEDSQRTSNTCISEVPGEEKLNMEQDKCLNM